MTIEAHTTRAPAAPLPTTLSLTEAARRVGISRRTLGRALAAGKLPRQPDGRVALADLLALGYELGPGGRSSVLAVRLLEELTAAHARELALLQQQVQAQQHGQHEVVTTLTAAAAALQTLVAQLGAATPRPADAGLVPSERTPPAPVRRPLALAGLASLLLLLLL